MNSASGNDVKNIEIRVRRFDPEKAGFSVKSYQVTADRFQTVLGALIEIKEKLDASLSMRYSCRMGICGSCAMVINGKPRLACETNIFLEQNSVLEVEPMQGHPILKDLVCDFDDFFQKHKGLKPWLLRKDEEERFRAEKEYSQTTSQLDYYLPFSYCIKCGLCVDACPVVNTNPAFFGPQALSQVYRYFADSRDEGGERRLEDVDTLDKVWGCEFAGSCSKVCPKGVDPALAIQLLKIEVMKHRFNKEASVERRIK